MKVSFNKLRNVLIRTKNKGMYEHFFQCPFCWETISMLLDSSVTHQKYIEDCEICCNPLELEVKFQEGELVDFTVTNIGQ